MVDYDKAIGTNPHPDFKGLMRIRDTGSMVELWIQAGSTSTYANNVRFGWTINGATGSGTFNYPTGKPLLRLKSLNVQSSQTVKFTLSATGTEGLGGPYTHSAYIDRGSVPNRPSRPQIVAVTHNSISVTFNDGYSDAGPITGRQILYGTNPSNWTNAMNSDGSDTITGLHPGRTYYIWARNRNAKGWSDKSLRAEATTRGVVRVKVSGVWREAVPYVRQGGVWRQALPYSKRAGAWKVCG